MKILQKNKTATEPRFTQNIRPNFVGFTLAEVLITLGIIGIVAALTMPILISHYKKQVVEVRLQRAYTTLAQAIKLATVDYGETSEWDYSNTDNFINTYLLPYMEGAKYISEASMGTLIGKFQNGYEFTMNGGNSKGIKLKTGEILKVYNVAAGSANTKVINVILKPNKENVYIVGKDYFNFYISKKNNSVNLCHDNSYYSTFSDDTLVSYCQTFGKEWACGLLIAKNSWKIPDNYPIKF